MERKTLANLLISPFLTVALLAVLLGACGPASTSAPWPTTGWPTSTPEEQGLDSEQLAALLAYLQSQDSFAIHSLMIVRNGHAVLDATFYPFAPGAVHNIASGTKSFMSTLIGIVIHQGFVESVEQPVLDFFPDRAVQNVDDSKEAMTLEDLLTMRSGLECIPQQGERTLQEMMASPDWVQFVLDLPMAAEPGTKYVYCSPGVHLLSAIIQETTSKSAQEFARERLFGPLGFSDVVWLTDPQNVNRGWGDLMLTPQDMAKLGYLYLNNGLWDGQQVLSADWAETATSPHARHNEADSEYGYLWWVDPSGGTYSAAGLGGQEIFVLPDQDMVVVMTGASGGGGPGSWGERLLESRILPLVSSKDPLPANPDGVAALAASIQTAKKPQTRPQPVPPLPEMAEQVAGQRIVLDPNPLGLGWVSLTFPEESEAALSLSFMDGSQTEWRVGLDDVLRFTPGIYGPPEAAKGGWASDNSFVIHHEQIGHHSRDLISVTFEQDGVTIQIQDPDSLDVTLSLSGKLE